MVKNKNAALFNRRIKSTELVVDNNPNECKKYPEGSTQGVFCQVQRYPRIVVLNEGFGKKKVLEVNPCVLVGKTDEACGFPTKKQPLFIQNSRNEIVPNPKANQNYRTAAGFDPNPPNIPPPKEQIYCYNLRSRLNMCNYNKKNFDYRLFPYDNVVYP